jgi:hypothetical protein
VGARGEAILRLLANRGEGATIGRDELARAFPIDVAETVDLLILRDLIECTETGYRSQVAMIRRWFTSPTISGVGQAS